MSPLAPHAFVVAGATQTVAGRPSCGLHRFDAEDRLMSGKGSYVLTVGVDLESADESTTELMARTR